MAEGSDQSGKAPDAPLAPENIGPVDFTLLGKPFDLLRVAERQARG